jgi:glycosyltransferase involved in cell wall biosynthesis
MQEVVKQLSERMALSGHQVDVACGAHSQRKGTLYNGVTVYSFSVTGSFVQGIAGERERYENFLVSREYDVVTFFAAQVWSTDIALPLMHEIKGKKVFVPTGFSALYQSAYREYYDQMKRWMKAFDMNVFLSHNYRDIQFAKDNAIDRIMVIPNASDEREFSALVRGKFRGEFDINPDHILILHVGSFTGLKGHMEALQIFNAIESDRVALCFIGNGYGRFPKYKRTKIKWWIERFKLFFSSKRLLILPPDRQRTLDAFADADIFLFPSNVECSPVVLFEAVASETPFLSNDVGNAREIAEWTKGGLIMPTSMDANGFSHTDISKGAQMLDSLISNKEQRKELASAGRKNWQDRFTWRKICDDYIALYYQMLDKK